MCSRWQSFAHIGGGAKTTIPCSPDGVTGHSRTLILYKEMQWFATHNDYITCSKAYMHTDSLALCWYYKSDKNNVILGVFEDGSWDQVHFLVLLVDSFVCEPCLSSLVFAFIFTWLYWHGFLFFWSSSGEVEDGIYIFPFLNSSFISIHVLMNTFISVLKTGSGQLISKTVLCLTVSLCRILYDAE